MADTLEELYNSKPGLFSALTDPFALKELANEAAINKYGTSESVGGKADALRHIMASSIMAKRHGDLYSQLIGDLHESRLPFVGSPAQPVEDREMDLYNNQIGRGLQSTSYADLMNQATQMVNSKKAKTIASRPAPVQQGTDYIDAAINPVSDWAQGHINTIKNLFK